MGAAVVAQVTWTPPPNFINALQRVFSTPSTLNNDFMITWVGTFNMGPSQAFFSIGTPTSLSPGAQVSTSANVGTTVFPSFDPNLNQYIVTWVDSLNATHYPMFTIYDVGTSTWKTPAAIPGASSAVGADGVISSLDPTTNTLIFTWTSLVIGNPPQYVTYNSSMMSPWGTPTPIPGGSATPPQSPIFSTFDPANLLYMFTWWGTDSNLGNYVTASLMQTMTTTTTVTTSPNPSQWNLSRSVDGSCD